MLRRTFPRERHRESPSWGVWRGGWIPVKDGFGGRACRGRRYCSEATGMWRGLVSRDGGVHVRVGVEATLEVDDLREAGPLWSACAT